MLTTIIRFENVVKKFENVLALDNLSLIIPENKIVGIIGANGAGKTTAVRHIIRYLKPETGSVFFREKNIYTIPDVSYPVSYIPDSPVFYEELTAMEHLSFVSAIYGTEAQVGDLISVMDMASHLNKVPAILSKGTKQKLLIMCALLRSFDVLLADEPFTGLDPKQIQVFRKLLVEQKEQGKTVVVSTHLRDVIDGICDYYIMIESGKLLAQGNLDEIINAGDCESLEELYLHLASHENDTTGVFTE